ncbi:MAG: lytic murein transglycosylase [Elusimicrobia bacterium]|nr:lytic murein transglycosylase [Elusimicrobiota bacterium]
MDPLALAFTAALAAGADVPPLPAGAAQDAAKAAVLEILRGTEVPPPYIEALFADPRCALDQRVADRFNNPPPNQGEALPWDEYRRRVVSEERIAAGVKFLSEHGPEASAAGAAFSVDRGILAAIAGVETFYGRNTGTYPVFNVYYTIANLVPRRSSWGAKELAALIRIHYNDASDPFEVRGSWAGAFGFVQFIPSSLLAYGVDFNGDGRRSLTDWPDALGSAANYLRRNGYPAGATDFSHTSPVYWSVYAYNHSDNYARAVLALREAIVARTSVRRPSAR